MTIDYFVRRLTDVVPNPWRAARIAENFIRAQKSKKSDLLNNRIHLSEMLIQRIREQIDSMAEKVFRDKIRKEEIRFHLVTDEELNYGFQTSFEMSVTKDEKALSNYGKSVQHSLFEEVFEREFNKLEKSIAFYLDGSKAIHWWHKIAARQEYFVQGWKRNRVFPDFLAYKKDDDTYLVIETKGAHLKGNEDTKYKEKLFDLLEKTYSTALKAGKMDHIGERPATYNLVFEDGWKEELNKLTSPKKSHNKK